MVRTDPPGTYQSCNYQDLNLNSETINPKALGAGKPARWCSPTLQARTCGIRESSAGNVWPEQGYLTHEKQHLSLIHI